MLTRPLLIRCVHTSGFWRLSKWSERIRLEMNNRNDTNGFGFIVAPRIMLSIFFKFQFDASPPKQQTGHILISRCEKSVYSNAFKLHITSFQENANDIVRCNRFGFACVTIIDFFSPSYVRCDHYLWTLSFLLALHVITCISLASAVFQSCRNKCRNVNDFSFRITFPWQEYPNGTTIPVTEFHIHFRQDTNINGIVDFYENYFGHLDCSEVITLDISFFYKKKKRKCPTPCAPFHKHTHNYF